jgi:hypothetical protein
MLIRGSGRLAQALCRNKYMLTSSEIENLLLHAFPQRTVDGEIALHDCEECTALRAELTGVTWVEIPTDFIHSNDGALPLLSRQAYIAFLPAWLRVGLREPDGPNAGMLLVNLREADTNGFTPQQAHAIVEFVAFITSHNIFGPQDPVNSQSLAMVRQLWSQVAA